MCIRDRMQVRQIAQSVIDDFPGLHVTTQFGCPGCVAAGDPRPTYWPLEEVAKQPTRCGKCGESLALQAIPLNPEKVASMSLMLDQRKTVLDLPEMRLASDKVRFGKPLEASLGLAKLLGLHELKREENQDKSYRQFLQDLSTTIDKEKELKKADEIRDGAISIDFGDDGNEELGPGGEVLKRRKTDDT